MHTRESIQNFLVQKIAEALELDPSQIDVNEPLDSFALNSIAALELVDLLEQHLGRPLPPTLLFDHANIAGVAEHLAEKG